MELIELQRGTKVMRALKGARSRLEAKDTFRILKTTFHAIIDALKAFYSSLAAPGFWNTVVRILLLDLAMANSRVEEYLNSSDQPFKLKASYLFSPDDEALAQMKAISKSMVYENLEKFLLDCLPQPSNGRGRNCIATSDAAFG
ncbi:hypothetical protein OROHE_013613 [Orobanche hederae]